MIGVSAADPDPLSSGALSPPSSTSSARPPAPHAPPSSRALRTASSTNVLKGTEGVCGIGPNDSSSALKRRTSAAVAVVAAAILSRLVDSPVAAAVVTTEILGAAGLFWAWPLPRPWVPRWPLRPLLALLRRWPCSLDSRVSVTPSDRGKGEGAWGAETVHVNQHGHGLGLSK